MDLWIRSQDKEVIMKTNNIFIYDENSLVTKVAGRGLILLGDYKTKERALEILDDIQEHINVKINEKNISTDLADLHIKGAILESMHKIYEMPKD